MSGPTWPIPKFSYWDPDPSLGYTFLASAVPNASSPGYSYLAGDILVVVQGGGATGGRLIISTIDPVSGLMAVTVLSGGASYQVGDVLGVVQSGGSGGAVTVLTLVGAAITAGAPNISTPGAGYAVNDVLGVVQSGGSGGQLKVATISTKGALQTAAAGSTPGHSYAVNDVLGVVQGGASGGQAKVSAVAAGPLLSAAPSTSSPGYSYLVGDILNAPGGSSGQLQVATLSVDTGIKAVVLEYGGDFPTSPMNKIFNVTQSGAGGGQVKVTGIQFVPTGGGGGGNYATGGGGVQPEIGQGYWTATSVSLYAPGTGYSTALNVQASGLTVDIQAGGVPATYTVHTAGTGYTGALGVSLTGGHGTGAEADTVAGGIPTSYTVPAGGTGYSNASALTTTGGSGTGAQVNITASGVAGVPTSYTLQAGGSSYKNAKGLATTGGGGTGALVDITAGGAVATVSISAAGQGYSEASATTSGGSGTGATLNAVAGGIPTAYQVYAPGTGYESATGLTETGGSGIGAEADVTALNSGGAYVAFTPTFPPVNKVPYGPYEAVRHDSVTTSGIKQSILERVDQFLDLDFQNVPLADMPAWAQMMQALLTGSLFFYYPNSTLSPNYPYTLEDMGWEPKRVSWNNYSFKIRLRSWVGATS